MCSGNYIMEVLRAAREVFAFNGPELVPEKQTDGPELVASASESAG